MLLFVPFFAYNSALANQKVFFRKKASDFQKYIWKMRFPSEMECGMDQAYKREERIPKCSKLMFGSSNVIGTWEDFHIHKIP